MGTFLLCLRIAKRVNREGEENRDRSESQRSERQMGALVIIADTELLISIRHAANGRY